MQSYSANIDSDNMVKVIGDLTMYTIKLDWWQEQSKKVLQSLNKQAPIVFNLDGLTLSDSAGLAWLINIVRDSQKHGYKVIFQNIPEELSNLAKISDASPLLPVQ